MNISIIPRFLIFFICAVAIAAPNDEFNLNKTDYDNFHTTLELIKKNKWPQAKKVATKNSTILSVYEWFYALDSKSEATFKEITKFINQHPNWPKQEQLENNAESKIDETVSKQDLLKWFANRQPTSAKGMLALAQAIENDREKSTALIKKAWLVSDFSLSEQKKFLKLYQKFLSDDDYIKRIDYLLWEGKITQSKYIMDFVSKDYQKLYQARINLMKNQDDVRVAAAKVPPYLKRDPGLIYQMCLKYEKEKDYTILTKLLLGVKNPQERQNKWWSFKARVMRELLKQQDFVNAYKLAIDHNNENISDYADAQWLAGWIALRFLNNESLAQDHFHNLYQKVKYPISLSRALYWLGRAYEKSKPQEAMQYYKLASQHVETFYGQLAMVKLDEKHIILPKPVTPSMEDFKHHYQNTLAKVAWLFAKNNRYEYVKLFNKAAIESVTSPGEMILISEMSNDNLHVLVDVSKHAAQKKKVFSDKAYPELGNIEVTNLEKPLILSIIRQESVFDHLAVSSAGAMGLMQIIPPTAKAISAELRVPLKKNKDFFYDHAYQIDLGSHYLRKLIDKYDGSYILAIAAYNAGPTSVNKWLEEYGDPRNKELEVVIDWIEIIPFHETRNYIQRVLENLQIYRLVSAKTEQDKSLCLVKDLCGIK